LLKWRYLVIVFVLLSVAQFYTVGSVTWPDKAIRYLDAEAQLAYGNLRDFLDVSAPVERTTTMPADVVLHRVARVVDGDTVYTRDGTKIRLHGIDAPERNQPYGREATRQLKKLLGSEILVESVTTDSYGRLVAVLFTPEGLNVNLEMTCIGAAWWYVRHAQFEWSLGRCQKQAQQERLGLWADDNPVAPWQWRWRRR
jgi:endonuclease YncB( thermonuclease family)